MLPNVVPIYKDEHIHSWIERLAIANGCSSLNQLLDSYSPSNKYKAVINAKSHITAILEVAEIVNWAEFYVTHTEYALVALFMDDYHQMMLLDSAFAGHSVNTTADINQLLVCPECQKEKTYIRVWHNLPGVKVCHKHRKTLITIRSGFQLVEPSDTPVSVEDVEYAKYCHNLHSANLGCSVTYINRILDGWNYVRKERTTVTAIKELMKKYPNVSDIPKQIIRNDPLPPGYTLLNKCGSVLEIEHKCGTRYCMTAKGLQYGFYCPSCSADLTEAEIVEIQIKAVGQGEYELAEHYERRSKKIKLIHKVCGAVYNVSLASFMAGSRCKCEHSRTVETLQKQFASKYPGFTPVSRQGEKILIRHNKCGLEFALTWKDWIRRPSCRFCDPLPVFTDDYIRQEMEKIGLRVVSIREGTSNKPKITVECSYGHQSTAGFYYIRDLRGCPKCLSKFSNSTISLMFEYLKVAYPNSLFFYDDCIATFGTTAKRTLHNLREKGLIKLVAHGCYAISDSDTEYTERDIIEQKYLHRDGETIGFLYGTSFAYYVLGIGEKPDIISISTKKEACPKGRLTHFSNTDVRLKRLPPGTREDLEASQVADFVNGIYKFIKNPEQHLETLYQYIEDHNISKTEIVRLILKNNPLYETISKRLLK